jgi:hypothetical protein
MSKLTSNDLLGLETYAKQRPQLRQQIIEHKKQRTLAIGPNVTWVFEDRETVKYQVQEMLRAERIFEQDGIQDELDAYNPLIPDGSNWKVTFLIEFPDEDERRVALAKMKGIEDRCWVQVPDFDRVYAIADEDLERENDEKTSSVHFLRFELSTAMSRAVKSGAAISAGIDHEEYRHAVTPVEKTMRESLAADLA